MEASARDRRDRTRLIVIGVAQIVWGVLLLLLATGMTIVWFVIGAALVSMVVLNRMLKTRLDTSGTQLPWRNIVLATTGVLLVATGTAIVFDGLAR